jgi:pectinesterase
MRTIRLNQNMSINKVLAEIIGGQKVRLFLKNGIYYEKVLIDKPNIIIEGQSQEGVRIVFDDYAKKIHIDGQEYNTFRTYTVSITAPNITLKNLSVVNSSGNPIEKGQSVALSLYGNNIKVINCTLESTQDTLFCGPLPDDLIIRYDGFLADQERYYEGEAYQYFENCKIMGSVDFIFGCGNARFFNCKIISINDGRTQGYVCAPAHSLKQDGGFIFLSCRFLNSDCQNQSVFLARPWRDFGKCVFIDCEIDSHINEALFDPWNDTQRDKTARFWYYNLKNIDESKIVSWAKKMSYEKV